MIDAWEQATRALLPERRTCASDRRRRRPDRRQPLRARGAEAARRPRGGDAGSGGRGAARGGRGDRAGRAARRSKRSTAPPQATPSPPACSSRCSRGASTRSRSAARAPPARSPPRASARNRPCRPRPRWTRYSSRDSGHHRLRSRARRCDRALARAREPGDRPPRRHDCAREPDDRQDDGQRAPGAGAGGQGGRARREGADRPLVRELHVAAHVHGESGLDGPELPPRASEPVAQHAVDFLVEHVTPETVLVPIGPLTNIALALDRGAAAGQNRADGRRRRGGEHDPGGGVQHLGGSRGRAACLPLGDRRDDDRARRHARRAPDPGVGERFSRAGRVGTFVAELVEFFKQYHARTYGWDGAPIHDAVAIAHVLRPGIVRTEHAQRRGGDGVGALPRAVPSSTAGTARSASRMRTSAWRSRLMPSSTSCSSASPPPLMPPGLLYVVVASAGALALGVGAVATIDGHPLGIALAARRRGPALLVRAALQAGGVGRAVARGVERRPHACSQEEAAAAAAHALTRQEADEEGADPSGASAPRADRARAGVARPLPGLAPLSRLGRRRSSARRSSRGSATSSASPRTRRLPRSSSSAG